MRRLGENTGEGRGKVGRRSGLGRLTMLQL